MRAQEWASTLAQTIRNEPPADDQLADVIADLQSAERTLADVRRMLMSEVTGPLSGREYRLVESRTAKRSYNTSGLLSQFGGFEALPRLVARDVIRISWQWSKLRRELEQADLPLTLAQHEITDGDPEALVGEVWESQFKVEPKRKP